MKDHNLTFETYRLGEFSNGKKVKLVILMKIVPPWAFCLRDLGTRTLMMSWFYQHLSSLLVLVHLTFYELQAQFLTSFLRKTRFPINKLLKSVYKHSYALCFNE